MTISPASLGPAAPPISAPIVTVIVLGSPVGKGRPRFTRKTGHAYTPEKTRRYEDILRFAAQQEMKGRAPDEGPIAVKVIARFPVPASWSRKRRLMALAGDLMPTKKPDADNLLKGLDSFNEVVWKDDAQIIRAEIVKRYDAIPALVVEVRAA